MPPVDERGQRFRTELLAMEGNINPRTAIVIQAYNDAATVADTLTSVSACRGIDMIGAVFLCDDASSDGTVEVARRTWCAKTPLTVLRNAKNIGERASLNRTFRELKRKFDWVFLLHADDAAKPNWLELYMPRIQACDDRVASICSSWDTWFPDLNKVVSGEDDMGRQLQIIPGDRAAVVGTLARGCWWRISGCVINLEAFFKVGEFKTDLLQVGDFEWLLRCLELGYSIEFIPRTTILYRQHPSSLSSNAFRDGLDLKETLRLYRKYHQTGFLTKPQWRSVQVRTASMAMRRMIKAGLRGEISRLVPLSSVLTEMFL
jgi:glycosyltransferase involved in cell wall biosynthesis